MTILNRENPVIEFNEILDMLNGLNPHAFTSKEYFKEMLQYTVEAKFDFSHYRKELVTVRDLYDDCMHQYNSDMRYTLLDRPLETENILLDGSLALEIVQTEFEHKNHQIEERLFTIMKIFLNADEDTKREVFGYNIVINPEEIEDWLIELRNAIDDVHCYYTQPDQNYCSFLEILKNMAAKEEKVENDEELV